MKTREIQSLSVNLTNDTIDMPYPHVLLENPTDAFALVVSDLESGSLSILCEHKGLLKRIGSVRMSALTLSQMSRTGDVTYMHDKNTAIPIKSIEDVMEVLKLWMQLSLSE